MSEIACSLTRAPASEGPAWVRWSTVALGAPNVAAGMWVNAHLATDAPAGLFASGLILVAAAWLGDVRSVRLAMIGFSGFTIPHAAYHVLNPAPGLSAGEDAFDAAVLLVVAATAIALVVAARPRDGADR